jgi:hypothetical protein
MYYFIYCSTYIVEKASILVSQSQQNSMSSGFNEKEQVDIGKRNRVSTDNPADTNVQGDLSNKEEDDELGFFPSSGDSLSQSIDPLSMSTSANRYGFVYKTSFSESLSPL